MEQDRAKELITEGLRRMNRGDVDGMLELLHPEVRWRAIPGPAGADLYEGHEGVRKFIGEWLEAWDAFEQELVDIETRGDWALARALIRTRGGISGIEFETEVTYVMQARDEQLARMEMFATYDEGRAVWEAAE